MQCKVGDLAIVVNDLESPENNGALLRIFARARPGQWAIPADWNCEPLSSFTFDGRSTVPGRGILGYRDCELKPLRDGDGEDQTIQWAGLPASLQPA